MKVLLLGPV